MSTVEEEVGRARARNLRFDRFPNHSNSLNALRLLLATGVLISHMFPLGGYGKDPAIGNVSLGTMCVFGFFAISGWLISSSAERLRPAQYAWNRILRIYPAFLVNLLLTTAVFAPIATWLTGGGARFDQHIKYVISNSLIYIQQYTIGDTLNTVPFAKAWNGSLWTLFIELLCYIFCALLTYMIGPRPGIKYWWLSAWLFFTLLSFLGEPFLTRTPLFGSISLLFPSFMAGAALHAWRHVVPRSALMAILSLALVLCVLSFRLPTSLSSIGVAYFTIFLAWTLPLSRVARKNDISYGVYIYAFPSQQLLSAAQLNHIGWPVYLAATGLLTFSLAWLSWLAIEKPALKFKRITWKKSANPQQFR